MWTRTKYWDEEKQSITSVVSNKVVSNTSNDNSITFGIHVQLEEHPFHPDPVVLHLDLKRMSNH